MTKRIFHKNDIDFKAKIYLVTKNVTFDITKCNAKRE